jgi:hypothetical protein
VSDVRDALPLLAFFAFVGVVLWLYVNGNRRRRQAWAQLGASLGLQFAGDDDSLLLECTGFSLFERSHARRIRNLLRGRSGRIRIALGEFHYDSERSRGTPRYFTVCVLERDGMQLPHSRLRPERWGLDALGQLLGGKDIDFEDDPDFSRAYVLQGVSVPEVRGLYDARIRRWFTERKRLGMRIETFGTKMVLSVPKVDLEKARELLDQGLDLMMIWGERYESRSAG